MLISKTKFINYLRCPRYVALEEIHQKKNDAIVTFSNSDDLEALMNAENQEKIKPIIESMTDENNNDILIQTDEKMDTMLKYYNEIELISGQLISKKFGGNIVYALDTFKQKRFEFEKDGFHFYCFLDGFQEDDEVIRIIEVKATTSKKFLDMTFKIDDEKVSIFEYSAENILMLREDLGLAVNEKYEKKKAKLKDRLSKEGRYIYDIAYQRYVLDQTLKTKKKVKYYLGILNSSYIHDGKTDENNHPIYGDDIMVFMDVSSLTESIKPMIKEDIKIVMDRLNKMDANPTLLGSHCQRKDARECAFYPICFSHIPEKNSMFSYLDRHHGFKDESGTKYELYDLINQGIVSALDIDKTLLNRKKNQIQREVMETKVPFINLEKIKLAIESIRYPIYHLDFETFPCPLPRFKGEKPYTQSLFQYSIHIEHRPGVCDKDKDNYGYIAKTHDDLRRELVESMLDVIKDDGGSIMVYNQSFEQTRLKEMAEIFPEHKERLLDMVDRLVDLMYFLRGNAKFFKALGYQKEDIGLMAYYHDDLNGSYSIKKVLPIFTNLSYSTLDIKNGNEALIAYANFPQMDELTFKMTYQHLYEYCKQDTWAMVEILNALRNEVF